MSLKQVSGVNVNTARPSMNLMIQFFFVKFYNLNVNLKSNILKLIHFFKFKVEEVCIVVQMNKTFLAFISLS